MYISCAERSLIVPVHPKNITCRIEQPATVACLPLKAYKITPG